MQPKHTKPTARPTRAAQKNEKDTQQKREDLAREIPLMVRFNETEADQFRKDLINANVGVQMVMFFDDRVKEALSLREKSIDELLTEKQPAANERRENIDGDKQL